MNTWTMKRSAGVLLTTGLLCLLTALALFTHESTIAQEGEDSTGSNIPNRTNASGSPLHPVFPLLDADGNNVLDSNAPVSPMQTCGSCHDTAFIAEHSVHADVGQSLIGEVETPREWQEGLGWYGGWNPITYVVLDTSNPNEWLQTSGWRHVGGGPASACGIEMNCFLCHLTEPNNNLRVAAVEAGEYAWASTATLADLDIVENSGDGRRYSCDGTESDEGSQIAALESAEFLRVSTEILAETSSIVENTNEGWEYNLTAFDAAGNLLPENTNITEPSNTNCGFCHGVVDESAQIPLTFDPFDKMQWHTLTTGQVFSPQRLSNSGLNLADKPELTRTWDIHAERAVGCTDCHYSLNNPVFYVESESTRPDHLEFDPRRMDFGDYLERPLHQFANGGADYVDAFPVFNRANRDCATCHDAVSTHTWLEYPARHMQALACETCHVPEMYAPALESIDWTVLDVDGAPQMRYRGADTSVEPALLTGYEPVLLPDDSGQLAPHNVISAWYWVAGNPAQPVSPADLQAVYLDEDGYAPEVLAVFDSDGDGLMSKTERVVDSNEKAALITERLAALGLENPRMTGEVEAYPIHHNTTHGEWAIKECSTCHSDESRLMQPIVLSSNLPGGTLPTLIGGNFAGDINVSEDGALSFTPDIGMEPIDLYILGHSSVTWVDWAGVLIFLGTLAGVVLHGGLRYLAARRTPPPADPELREVYMYSIYERQWHWLQSAVIFGLLFTGIVIHKPDMFAAFGFRWMVLFHNAFAVILIINAALAAFYHLASGEIRQFLPEPRGFFGQMFAQARYYAWGIFRGEPHPFEKTRNRKLNPIQQVTYLGLLNVLLPLQVITGALMWGAQHVPGLTEFFGGLPLLAPFHTLIAWLLASFIVLHVYMTTTGHTPMANIRAMMLGWDEVEVHEAASSD